MTRPGLTLLILSMSMISLLAGCGQVIMFGHVVREGQQTVEPKPASAADTPASTASAATNGAPAAPAPTTGAGTVAAPPASSAAPANSASRSGTQVAAASPSAQHPIKAVSLVVTAEAAERADSDAGRFTADALLDAIKAELKSRKLLDEQDPHAAGTAEIVVDGLGTRPTSNAILFGYRMLAGTLEGDIRVKAGDGTESTGARIVAESKLTIAADGEDKNPLGPLYRRFAVLAADRLARLESRSPDSAGTSRY